MRNGGRSRVETLDGLVEIMAFSNQGGGHNIFLSESCLSHIYILKYIDP